MNLNELFFELSHEGRYDIFKKLCENKKRHSQLNKELNITGPEITRHLKRLSKKNLIKKGEDGRYGITNIGGFFTRVLDFFEVALNHIDFFNTHDFSPIPQHLLVRIGELKYLETNNKTLENIDYWSNLIRESEDYIWAVSGQFQHSLLPVVEKKIQDQSIEIRGIVDKNLLKTHTLPDEWSKQFKDPIAFYKNIKIFKNIKYMDNLDLSLIVCDKGAIIFLSRDNQVDYSQCLLDIHPSFIQWTKDLFEWHWNKAKEFRPYVRKEMRGKQKKND